MDFICHSMDMAEYAVTLCANAGRPVTDLHLQKMLYFLQVAFCGVCDGKRLIFPEKFQAWRYGPVLPDVYERFSAYGGGSINRSFDCSHLDGFLSSRPNMKHFIDSTIGALRDKSPWALVAESHAVGSPWDITWNGSGNRSDIPNELIVRQSRGLK